VELHTKNPTMFEDGGEFAAVRASRSGFGTVSRSGVRVREIKVRLFRDSFEQTTGPDRVKLVPTHMRQFDFDRQQADISGKNA
jgi:hypothetical protein